MLGCCCLEKHRWPTSCCHVFREKPGENQQAETNIWTRSSFDHSLIYLLSSAFHPPLLLKGKKWLGWKSVGGWSTCLGCSDFFSCVFFIYFFSNRLIKDLLGCSSSHLMSGKHSRDTTLCLQGIKITMRHFFGYLALLRPCLEERVSCCIRGRWEVGLLRLATRKSALQHQQHQLCWQKRNLQHIGYHWSFLIH